MLLESSSRQMQPSEGCLLTFPARPPPRALLAVEGPDSQPGSGQSGLRNRRSHRKSRTGCRTCKGRRVKCDETKPQCRRCQTYGIACDFISATVDRRFAATPQTSPERNGALAFDAMSVNVDAVLQSDRHSSTFPILTRSLGLATLAHFAQMVGARQTAYAPIKQVLRDRTIPLALTVGRGTTVPSLLV